MAGDQLPLTDASGTPLLYEDKTRAQRVRYQSDIAMLKLARAKTPGVLFWWFLRDLDGAPTVFCRLCEQHIEVGNIKVGFTAAQLDLIEGHKLAHWRDLLPNGSKR